MFKAGVCDWIEECHDAVHCRITPDMLPILSSEFSAKKIKAAMFQIGPTKALRPDDMNAFFYKKFQHLIGDDVINAVLDFFEFW